MWLPKRDKTFSTKTLIAALRVPALLRTRAVHLTLIHICCGKQGSNSGTDGAKAPVMARWTSRERYLRTCVFQWLWAYNRACTNKSSLPLSDRYSCVRRYCRCTCAHLHGLTGENIVHCESITTEGNLTAFYVSSRVSYSRQPSSSDWSPQSS